jgi:hypothetical protein
MDKRLVPINTIELTSGVFICVALGLLPCTVFIKHGAKDGEQWSGKVLFLLE